MKKLNFVELKNFEDHASKAYENHKEVINKKVWDEWSRFKDGEPRVFSDEDAFLEFFANSLDGIDGFEDEIAKTRFQVKDRPKYFNKLTEIIRFVLGEGNHFN